VSDELSTTTRVISKPDGSETLRMRCAHLSVVRGPQTGLTLEMTKSRVRVGTGSDCDLRLADAAVSRDHFELQATEAGYLLRDLASTNGTLLGGARIQRALLTEATVVNVGKSAIRIEPAGQTVEFPLSSRGLFGGLLGQSPVMRHVFSLLEQVAPTESTVLLEGESGTGKELAAQAIHQASGRSDGPFVVVDCGAIPDTLLESELFGHERGAFTGADHTREGALELADGGTLFLDEVPEIPLALQPRLLRFLESHQVKRVGAARHRTVDVRVVAATNRRLARETEEGRFREDLYYRLSVVRIELPPLRERPEDILLLAYHFAEPFVGDPAELISDSVASLLRSHDWPGNARELRNAVERIAVAPRYGVEELRDRKAGGVRPPRSEIEAMASVPFHEARQRWQDAFESRYLALHLEQAGGVVAHAAETMQLPRQTLHRLLKKHGIKG